MNALQKARNHLASLPFTAAGLVGRKVQVIFDPAASTAYTDGKRITLPAMPLPTSSGDIEAAAELRTIIEGYIHHEAGHCIDTDFEVAADFMRESEINRSLVNILEDCREERFHIACWPGSRKSLDALPELLRKKTGVFQPLTENYPPASILTGYVLYFGRARLRNQPFFEALAAESRDVAIKVLGASVIARIEGLVQVVGPAMRSTADALELAKEIRNVLEDEAKDPPPEQDPQKDDSGDDEADGNAGDSETDDSGDDEADDDSKAGDSGDDEADGNAGDSETDDSGDDEADGNAGDSETDDSGDDEADGNDGSDDAGEPGEGDASQGGSGEPAAADESQRQSIKDALSDTDAGNMAKDLGDHLSESLQKAMAEVDPTGYADKAESSVIDILEAKGKSPDDYNPNPTFSPVKGLVTSGQLRSVLKEKFRAMTTARFDESRRGSRLNQRRVHRLSANDARVFIRTTDRRELDTAVFLLADVSGSMSLDNRIGMASDAMLCTAAALSGLPGVKVAAGTFPGLFSVLKFGESPMGRTARFGLPCFGSTPMHEGVVWATGELSRRAEARKILLVMTDGEPDCSRRAKAAIEAARAVGIEVMAIGIKHPAVKTLFSDSVVITDLPELPRAMMVMLGTALEQSIAA